MFAPSGSACTVVAMATEFGCERIVPVITARGENHLPPSAHAEATTAAKRSGRSGPPRIDLPLRLIDAVEKTLDAGRSIFFCDERGDGEPLAETCAKEGTDRAALLVGPRDGFAPKEHNALRVPGVVSVSLGTRLLSPEASAVAGCAFLHLGGVLDFSRRVSELGHDAPV